MYSRVQPFRTCAPHTVGYTNAQAVDEGAVAELRPTFVREWFDPHGASRWVRLGVDGGSGSCFFHAVCAVLNYGDYLTADLPTRRALAVQLRRSFIPRLTADDMADIARDMGGTRAAATVDQVRAELHNPEVWANESVIRFVLRELGINLVFIDTTRCDAYCGVQGDEALQEMRARSPVQQPTGFIAWNLKHFDAIGRLKDGQVLHPRDASRVQFLFHPRRSAKDAAAVSQAMGHYADQCSRVVQE